jgi:hypothetical protein
VFFTFGDKFGVFPCEFEYLFGVILKFDLCPGETATGGSGAKGHREFHLSLLLPALGVALDGLPVGDRLADRVHVAHTALAVVADLRLARGVHLAVSRRVAPFLATVLAVLQGLTTWGTATFCY